MKEFPAGKFDITVIGAGHAGIEGALAAARMGLETIIFTINLDAVGNMPCNPAIGGTGSRPPGPGAGRSGRRDGPGGGCGLHPVPDAQPGQGPSRPLPAGPGGTGGNTSR